MRKVEVFVMGHKEYTTLPKAALKQLYVDYIILHVNEMYGELILIKKEGD